MFPLLGLTIITSSNFGRPIIFVLAFYSSGGDAVITADYVQLPSAWIGGQHRPRVHEMNECSRSSALRFVGAIDQASQLAQLHQHLGHRAATVTAYDTWRRERMKLFKQP